jgi:hypothetical protein
MTPCSVWGVGEKTKGRDYVYSSDLAPPARAAAYFSERLSQVCVFIRYVCLLLQDLLCIQDGETRDAVWIQKGLRLRVVLSVCFLCSQHNFRWEPFIYHHVYCSNGKQNYSVEYY